MDFSLRTNWYRQQNRITAALEHRKHLGEPIFDLTVSNPTQAGIPYPQREILSSLSHQRILTYHPEPRGLFGARGAIVSYYASRAVAVDPDKLFLTASSSESYSFLLRLLCNPGDSILVPRPSYPLFDYLAQINDVTLSYYSLRYDGRWDLDIDSCRRAITSGTKAIVVINPHNPTGMFLHHAHLDALSALAAEYDFALIVDEVFIDYPLTRESGRVKSTATNNTVLTFTLNGLSKSVGLPQLKAGWIAVSGPGDLVNEATDRLEILSDTFLSVNTPVQEAMGELLREGSLVRHAIGERVGANYAFLQEVFDTTSVLSPLHAEGGWYGIIRTPSLKPSEDWALEILEQTGVYCYPGYFFDFEEDHFLVVSLLPEENLFRSSLRLVADFMRRNVG